MQFILVADITLPEFATANVATWRSHRWCRELQWSITSRHLDNSVWRTWGLFQSYSSNRTSSSRSWSTNLIDTQLTSADPASHSRYKAAGNSAPKRRRWISIRWFGGIQIRSQKHRKSMGKHSFGLLYVKWWGVTMEWMHLDLWLIWKMFVW